MNELLQKIEGREATIGVIGLGYVGLPLISAFFHKEFKALGFDVDQTKVDALNEGRSYIKHISSDEVKSWRESGRFEATADAARLAEPDVLEELMEDPQPRGVAQPSDPSCKRKKQP